MAKFPCCFPLMAVTQPSGGVMEPFVYLYLSSNFIFRNISKSAITVSIVRHPFERYK